MGGEEETRDDFSLWECTCSKLKRFRVKSVIINFNYSLFKVIVSLALYFSKVIRTLTSFRVVPLCKALSKVLSLSMKAVAGILFLVILLQQCRFSLE